MVIPQAEYEQIIARVPIVCVDVAIYYYRRILLIKRLIEPAKGQWWLPGGRLFKGETIDECALRKATEEVGLTCHYDRIIHFDSTIFETGPNGIPIHSINFCTRLFAYSDDVYLDETCSDYRWVDRIDPEYDEYIKKCLGKAIHYYD